MGRRARSVELRQSTSAAFNARTISILDHDEGSSAPTAHLHPIQGRTAVHRLWRQWRALSQRWWIGCALLYAAAIIAYFARGLWRGDVLATEDATGEYFPQFQYPYHAWTRLLFSGYPLFADPQNMSFLPTRVLLSAVGGWDAFVLSGYVIAGCCACAYAYELTQDRYAALAAGLFYAATGHMLRNFTIVPMVQSMAWTPLVFWSMERLVRRPSGAPMLIGAIALACCCFGGYGQIAAYTGVLALAYAALGIARSHSRWRFAVHATGVFALGGLVSAVQWLPTLELMRQSQRTHMPYGGFVSYGWTFVQSAELLIPRAFVGPWSDASRSAACGLNGGSDHAYFGLLPLILGGAGAWLHRRSAVTWFWLFAAAFSLALAFGDLTPVARWMYHVPPYNLFRVLVRHSMFLALGLSALSACALASLRSPSRSAHDVRRALSVAAGGIVVAFLVAASASIRHGCTSAWSLGIVMSAAVLMLCLGALALWARQPSRSAFCAALIACAALDLLTFDGGGDEVPHYAGRWLTPKAQFEPPAPAAAVTAELEAHHQRIWAVGGAITGRADLSVNLNLLWDVPSAAGYSPIAPTHSLEVLDMMYSGRSLGPFWDERAAALDVSAVRLVALGDVASRGALGAEGVRWSNEDLGILLGATARRKEVRTTERLRFAPSTITGIGVVLDMDDSMGVREGSEVALLDLEGKAHLRIPLIAGSDISEWAIDCPSVHSRTRHARAVIYDSRDVQLNDAHCPWHRYVVLKRLREPVEASSLSLTWSSDVPEAVVRIHKITLLSQASPQGTILDQASSAMSDETRWRPRAALSPGRLLFENRRALPRAHFVDAVVEVPLDAALATLRVGQLPSGAPFDPCVTALVTPGASVNTHPGCASARIEWLQDRDGFTSFAVDAPSSCFLVLADTFYDGWQARVDGELRDIRRTNFAFRGVEVPAGKHHVEFSFESTTLRAGAAISSCSLLLVALVAFRRRRRLLPPA